MGSLPAPSSGLFLEVSFRRSLASCEEIAAGDCKGRDDLKSWRTSPMFHHYIETLQDQLKELCSTAGSRIDRELLEQYKQHVAALAGQLGKPELSAAAARPAAALQNGHTRSPALPLRVPTLPPATADTRRSEGGSEAQPPLENSSAAAAKRPQPVEPPTAAAAAAAACPPPPPKAPRAALSSQAAQSKLQTHANLQEALTEELAGMAASLKSSTLAVEGRLRERGQLLGATETALDHSLHHTRKSAAEAKKIHSKGRINFCLTLLVMLAVGLTFAGMFLFIKFTSFAGYRATRVQPAAPPTAAAGEL